MIAVRIVAVVVLLIVSHLSAVYYGNIRVESESRLAECVQTPCLD